jgi:hypothetical protein
MQVLFFSTNFMLAALAVLVFPPAAGSFCCVSACGEFSFCLWFLGSCSVDDFVYFFLYVLKPSVSFLNS